MGELCFYLYLLCRSTRPIILNYLGLLLWKNSPSSIYVNVVLTHIMVKLSVFADGRNYTGTRSGEIQIAGRASRRDTISQEHQTVHKPPWFLLPSLGPRWLVLLPRFAAEFHAQTS